MPDMKQLPSIIATIVKMMLGMLFLFSAASKYVALDQFELYIYSFDFLPQGGCFVLARAVLAGELLLGIWLLSNRWHRLACLCNVLLLTVFSLFLAYAALSGRQDSCNCFGELLPFDPLQSLLKNAVLLLLTLVAWRWTPSDWRPRWWLVVLMVVLPFETLIGLAYLGKAHMIVMERNLLYVPILSLSAIGVISSLVKRLPHWLVVLMVLTPFVVMAAISTAPEDWTGGNFRYPYDKELIRAHTHEGGALAEARTFEGRKVVALYSLHCTHCRATASKVSAVQRHNSLADSLFVDVFMGSVDSMQAVREDTLEVQRFYTESHALPHSHFSIHPRLFVEMTRGQFPLVLLVDGDSIYQTFGTVVPEKEILNFLHHEDE